MAATRPTHLYFTGDDEADRFLAEEPLALLVGFVLDQQVTVQKAFSGPLEIRRRLGTFDAAHIAATDPGELAQIFRQKPAMFPGIGPMKARSLIAILVKRFGVTPPGWEEVAPQHRTLGDVDSAAALADYQAAKRAHKAAMRAAGTAG